LPSAFLAMGHAEFDPFTRVDLARANLWAHNPAESPRQWLCDTARRECAGVLLV
jgi:hypothetical protein